MTRRLLILTLLFANIAGFVTGSAPAAADDAGAQAAIDRLDLESFDTDKVDTLIRDGNVQLYRGYAEDTYGYTEDDLRLLREGALVVPQGDDVGAMNIGEVMGRVTSVRKDLDEEAQRDRQSVKTTLEAEAMEQYLQAFHDALESDYDQAKEFSDTHLDEYIKFLNRYYEKFPAVVYACT